MPGRGVRRRIFRQCTVAAFPLKGGPSRPGRVGLRGAVCHQPVFGPSAWRGFVGSAWWSSGHGRLEGIHLDAWRRNLGGLLLWRQLGATGSSASGNGDIVSNAWGGQAGKRQGFAVRVWRKVMRQEPARQKALKAKTAPSEASFCRLCSPIARLHGARRRWKVDRCGRSAANDSSAAQPA